MRSPSFTPSASKRWLVCTASAKAIEDAREAKKIPEKSGSSKFADEGTVAHEYASAALLLGAMPVILDLTMAEAIEDYVNFVRSFGGELFIEERVSLFYEPTAKGTMDAGIVLPDRLVFADLKYGVGIDVGAVDNTQLTIYTGSFYFDHPELHKLPDNFPVELYIYQPRAINGKAVREWHTTLGELRRRWATISETVVSLKAGNPGEFAPSKEVCQDCPIKGLCVARGRAAFAELDVVADEPVSGSLRLPPAGLLTPEQVGAILSSRDDLTSFLNAVAAQAYEIIERGEEVPGWKIVSGIGDRRWADEAQARGILEEKLKDSAFNRTLVSPAQAEKAIKVLTKSKAERETFNMTLDLLVERPTTAPRLVASGHPGKPVTPKHEGLD